MSRAKFRVQKSNTICMCLIVKNEEHVIARCMRSFAPVADYFIICDTGSTDRTIEVIRETARDLDLPGEVYEHPWKNFAHNRTLSLKLGKEKSKMDYLLVIDADEVLKYKVKGKNGFFEIEDIDEDPLITIPPLDKDCYNVLSKLNSITYERLQLLSTRLDWRYESVVHEYAIADGIQSLGRISEFMNMPRVEGARSKDPNKYLKDAMVLEKGLLDEPDNSRYYFYLGQSYRDGGQYEKAIQAYKKRTEMTGFEEELNVCYHQLGYCSKIIGRPVHEYIYYYLEGYKLFPHRLECAYEYIKELRETSKMPEIAYQFGRHLIRIPYPDKDQLFILKEIYTHLMRFELAQCCIETSRYEEAIILLRWILDREWEVPPESKAGFEQYVRAVSDLLGYTIESMKEIVIEWNEEDILRSRVRFDCPRNRMAIFGSKQAQKVFVEMMRDQMILTGTQVPKDHTWKDGTVYWVPRSQMSEEMMNETEKKKRWNIIPYDTPEDLTKWRSFVELDRVRQRKYLETTREPGTLAPFYQISRQNKDILVLGTPTMEQLERILGLMTGQCRIFVFCYGPGRPEHAALIERMKPFRNVFISNIGTTPYAKQLDGIFTELKVSNVRIGWVVVYDLVYVDRVQASTPGGNDYQVRGRVMSLHKHIAPSAFWEFAINQNSAPAETGITLNNQVPSPASSTPFQQSKQTVKNV